MRINHDAEILIQLTLCGLVCFLLQKIGVTCVSLIDPRSHCTVNSQDMGKEILVERPGLRQPGVLTLGSCFPGALCAAGPGQHPCIPCGVALWGPDPAD